MDDVEFTIYDNFPFASVKINNLLLKESENFDNDTLLFTKRAYVELSLIDIFNKNFDIKNIIVTDATVNFKYNDLNESNFEIFKKNDGKNNVSINKITVPFILKRILSMLINELFISTIPLVISDVHLKFIFFCLR